MKWKPEPEVVFRAIWAKNQISGFSRPRISAIRLFGGDKIGWSMSRPVTLWTAVVDWKPNCYAPVTQLQSRWVYESVTDEFADNWSPISKQNSLICHIQMKLWPFLRFVPISAKIWLPSLTPLQSEMSFLNWLTMKNPVVSNHIIVISHRNAFIAIFVPKLGAMVMPLCPLCMGVSQMNSLIAENLSQNKTLHWCVVFNWSCGHFCEIFSLFWPKFGCHGNVP